MITSQPSAATDTPERRADAPRLVVGVDGSTGGEQALRWALREATPGQEVLAALAFGPLGRPPDLDALQTGHLDELVPAAKSLLEKAVAQVTGSAELPAAGTVATAAVYDEPVAGLLELLRPPDVLVLGSRGWGRLRRLLLGSVASQCLQQHPGTVVVVRGAVATDDRRSVLVGVDGTPDSLAALTWAAEFAVRHGAPLRAVRAWSAPASLHPVLRSVYDRQRAFGHARAEPRRLVRSTLTAASGDLGELDVATDVLDGSSAATLTGEADQRYQLLVVGRGGATALRHRRLGSTSLSCAVNAATSVAVVEAPAPSPATAS